MTLLNGGAPVFQVPTTPWVHGLDIVVSEIPFVEGQVAWPSHRFRTVLGWFTRRFIGNGLPTHVTGEFPVQEGTAAYEYYHAAPAGGDYTWSDEIPIKTFDPQSKSCHDAGFSGSQGCRSRKTSSSVTGLGD
ncbi:MAG: hypothetical protein WCO04_04785 [Pseudomonadota bacterium]